MRLLAYVHAYVPDHMAGAETTLHDILKGLQRRGCEVVVATSTLDKNTEPYTYEGIFVVPFDGTDRFKQYADWADVVISHLECSERSAIWTGMHKKPMVHLVHNTMWQTDNYLSEGCDLAIFNSHWVAAHYLTDRDKETHVMGQVEIDFGPKPALKCRSVVVHPTIDPEKYKVDPGLDGSYRYITQVNMFEQKGTHVFYEMAKRFPNEKFLAVLGGYGEQDIREGYPNVTFAPNHPDIRKYLKYTKIVLMPSKYESFGRVAIEAAASGIPTVATPTPGLLEALGPKGVYAETMDDWEYRIQGLRNPALYELCSEDAKKRSAYWAGHIEPEMDALYEELIDL